MTGMATTQLLPDRQELETLAHAAFMNSRHQLASAELLLERAHWPVAHALATLALEEIGKSFLCMFASTNPEPFRAVFWKVFVSHTIKLQIAHVALAPMAAGAASQRAHEAILAFSQMAKADHATKMRGLYVDYADGVVLDPADVTEQDAQSMVALACVALDYLAPATTDEGLDPELRAILTASAAYFAGLVDSPDTDLEDLLQQLWDEVVAGGIKPPSWIPLDLLPESGSTHSMRSHAATSPTTPSES